MWMQSTLMTLMIFGLPYGAWRLANQEVSTSTYTMEWTGKGWKCSDAATLPSNIKSPYGFMHNAVLAGKSYTLVVPQSRWAGLNEVRVHIW